ncbi:MAG: NadS family protein [Pseudomonadota bacterium]
MKKVEFDKLLGSVQQAGDIAAGRRRASRVFRVASTDIKSLRTQTQLSQPDFAALLGVEVSTLRNWEQGRREPTGPAKALLRAIRNDPKNVLRALADAR